MTGAAPAPEAERPWAVHAAEDRAARARRRRTIPLVLFLLMMAAPFGFVWFVWSRIGGPARFGVGDVVPVLLLMGVGYLLTRVARWFQNRRHERLAAWGRAHGFAYLRYDRDLLRLQRGAPFQQGDGHAASEVLHRPWQAWHAVSFTYEWDTGSGDDRRTSYAQVVALHLPTRLPRLEVTPEGLGAKVAKLVGGKDLQLELEEFNREYRVVADDERTAHAVLHPRLMERLLQPDLRGTRWRIEGRWLVTWASGRTEVERIEPMLRPLTAVADAVPRHVWQDHGHDPAALDVR